MTRREFTKSAAGALVIAGAGAGVAAGCSGARAELRPAEPLEGRAEPLGPLGPEEERILAHAALAPSGHNAQPWTVRILERRRWLVGADPGRKLPAVDPTDRELALSIGAFVENLAVAAAATGLAAEVEVRGEARDAPELLAVSLVPSAPGEARDLERIRLRRTLRNGLRSDRLEAEDLRSLTAPFEGGAAWFQAGSHEARWLAEAELEAFRQQTWRDDAQAELSRWIRFSDEDVERHRDGLTPASMEMARSRRSICATSWIAAT